MSVYTLKEHEEKKLYDVSKIVESAVLVRPTVEESNFTQMIESAKNSTSKRKLIVEMEAIHVGITANGTMYTEEGLKNGISSWTHPYNKPVLTHHNQHSGETIGRILSAKYSTETKSGRKGLIFTVEITDPDAQEKVLDGRYQTVSIGATTDKVTCNICGTNRAESWCDHWKGRTYEGQTCHFIVGDTFGQEVSYVNVPADQDAGNLSVSELYGENVQESYINGIIQMTQESVYSIDNPTINLFESINDELKEQLQQSWQNTKPTQQKEGSISMELKEFLAEKFGSELSEADIQGKIETILNENKKLNKDLEESTSQLGKATIEKSKVEEQLQEKAQENEKLLNEQIELKKQLQDTLIEKVVDLKISLHKPDVMAVTREEAITAHASRTKESLENTLEDLLLEAKDIPERGSVPNPAQPQENQKKKIGLNESIDILKGAFGQKKK